MNSLLEILNHPVTQRLGWTLLNAIWQGALLAAFFAALRAAWRGRSANVRYLAGCLTLLLMAAAPVATFWLLSDSAPSSTRPATPLTVPAPPTPPPATVTPPPAVEISTLWLANLGVALDSTLPWLVAGWCLGVAILSLRLALGWFHIRRARTRSGESLEAQLGLRLCELQRRLRLSRPVRMVKSALVEVPTVIGWFRPMILLPASTLTGLSPVQIDLILAHELAHLRRWDQWVNLVQIAIETLLFYHPAVWWVSRCVRDEREHCCDEMAVAVCGNRLAYAQALATLEELRQAPADLALAAAGGSLLARIRRVLSLPDDERGGGRLAAAGSALIVVGILMFAAGVVLYATSERLFTATARVSVMQSKAPSGIPGIPSNLKDPVPFDPYVVQTEFERMQSRTILLAVADRLGLAKKWASAGAGTELEPHDVLDRLRKCLELRLARNSSLIEIRVTDRNSAEAAEIANAIAGAFQQWHMTNRTQNDFTGIGILETNLMQQAQHVRDLQAVVDRERTRLSIVDSAGDGPGSQVSFAREMLSSLAPQLTSARSEYLLARTKLDELRKLDAATLRQAILTAVPGEEILPGLLRDIATIEQTLAKLRPDFSADYPEVKRTLALQKKVESQIQDRIQGILTGLEKQVVALDERYDQIQRYADDCRKKAAEEAREQSVFYQAKRDLENEQKTRDVLQMRLLQEKVDANIPPVATAKVEIVDTARPDSISRRTSHPLDVSLMAAGVFTTLSGLGMRLGGRKPGAPAAPAM